MLRSGQREDLARTVHQALHPQKVLLCLLVHCVLPESVAQRTEHGCQLHSHEVAGLSRDGDVILGGIFPLHDDVDIQKITFTVQPAPISCQRFRSPNYRALQAMVFAIEEINANPNILPNITIGFQIYDSCRIMQRSLEGTLWILAGTNEPIPNFCCQKKLHLTGVIGDAGSSGSVVMARVLGLYRLPQTSYVSSSPILSDRNQFPSFFRTIPSDIFQSQGLAEILIHFGWTWVGLLAEDNDYGQLAATLLKKELEKAGACIAFSENIILSRSDRNALHIIRVIQSSTANVIVVICSDAGLSPLIEEITKHKVTGKVWIASEGWSISTTLSIERFSNILTGTIGFATRSEEIPGFVEHLNRVHPSRYAPDIFAQKLWEEVFGCQWMDQKQLMDVLDNRSKVCTGKENLELPFIGYNDGTRFRGPYNVYIAVYANAWALHSLISSKITLLNGFQEDILDFKPWQLLHYVKNVRFKNRAGTALFFSQTGEVPAQYDVVNWHRTPNGGLQSTRIGTYDSTVPQGQRLIINTSAIQWPSGKTHTDYVTILPKIHIGSIRPFKDLVGRERLTTWEVAGVGTLGTLFRNGLHTPCKQLQTNYGLPVGHFLAYAIAG
ncbi:hypothetical protein NDU88_000649 [Pleurodeles waltl]|uniref:Receptor ligand binding region domain-containing protein n=1 Tax=Pleurodeles waltl TaxID=8319 RepID=A0AAV7KRC1_PLEWA|nr:hypothetical protein NDU88_000649 [Pleurodeles waltl]